MVTARGQDAVKKNWNPIKYWKLLNQYINSKKTWISNKNMEKLKAVCEQEESKDKFLQQMRTFTLGTSQKA